MFALVIKPKLNFIRDKKKRIIVFANSIFINNRCLFRNVFHLYAYKVKLPFSDCPWMRQRGGGEVGPWVEFGVIDGCIPAASLGRLLPASLQSLSWNVSSGFGQSAAAAAPRASGERITAPVQRNVEKKPIPAHVLQSLFGSSVSASCLSTRPLQKSLF